MRNKRGFTLIEMMIVVAIIALLATIAIPNYINFQYRAKTSEAKVNLGAMRTCEEAYKAEENTYIDAPVNPASIPSATRVDWDDTITTGWVDMGFEPVGDLYYQYQVTGSSTTEFIGWARGDLDGDGTNSVYSINQDGDLSSSNPLE